LTTVARRLVVPSDATCNPTRGCNHARNGRLALAVDQAASLEQANEALHAIGVRTELDLEREAAAAR